VTNFNWTSRTGTRWINTETVEGAKTTNAAGEGQIASGTINTYNLTPDAVDETILNETKDYTVNALAVTTDVVATGNVSGVNGTFTGDLTGKTVAGGTNGTEFTVDADGNVVIAGDLTVNGDNVVANTTTLDVEDKNVTVAKGGTGATADGAGLTVDITDGTSGSIVYDSTSASKFAAGELGSEDDVVTATVTQDLENKTYKIIDGDSTDAGTLTIDGTGYTDIEDALVALNSVVGGVAQTLYTDSSALAGSDLTVAGAGTIIAVYASGIRLSEGASNDYTVSGEVITFAEAPLGNIVVDFKTSA